MLRVTGVPAEAVPVDAAVVNNEAINPPAVRPLAVTVSLAVVDVVLVAVVVASVVTADVVVVVDAVVSVEANRKSPSPQPPPTHPHRLATLRKTPAKLVILPTHYPTAEYAWACDSAEDMGEGAICWARHTYTPMAVISVGRGIEGTVFGRAEGGRCLMSRRQSCERLGTFCLF